MARADLLEFPATMGGVTYFALHRELVLAPVVPIEEAEIVTIPSLRDPRF